ncbi:thioesterase family protein [Pseudomonas alliivorans]|nr:thioesterase family protein [Pseudomonas alliivorans]
MTSLAQIFQSFDPSTPFNAPENWLQGRTVYGGLTAALALHTAIQAGGPELPPLKSAQITFVGPAMLEQTFKPTVLRQGKSVTVMTTDCFSSAQLALHMTVVFAASRDSRILHDYSQRPAVGRPDDYPVWDAGPHAPNCVHNFQKRPAGGTLPFSGAAEPELLMWVRHEDAQGIDPMVALMALADALPPASITTLTTHVPLSTITWTLDIVNAPAQDQWFLLKASSHVAADGYSFQDMEIWSERGELVLRGRQTVAIFA